MPDNSSRRRRHDEHNLRREPVTCSRPHGLAFWLAFFEHKSTVSHCFGTTGQRICYLSSTWGYLLWDKTHVYCLCCLTYLPSWSSMVFSLWEIWFHLILDPLSVMCLYSLDVFKIFSLPLILSNLILICLGILFVMFLLLNFLGLCL